MRRNRTDADASRHRLIGALQRLSVLCVLGGLLCLASSAEAQRSRSPADYFKHQIVLSELPFPADFESDAAFIKYVKKTRVNELWPDKEGGSWNIEYMAFFKKGLLLPQYMVSFYDITTPNRPIFITENPSTPANKGMRIMNGHYRLDTKFFKPEKKYLMTFSEGGGGEVLAEVEFVLRGFDADRAAKLKAQREAEIKRMKEERERKAADKKNRSLNWEPPNW